MIPDMTLPGFVATTGSTVETPPGATVVDLNPIRFAHWGVIPLAEEPTVLPLSRIVRTTSGIVPDGELVSAMRADPEGLMTLLPPFAAVAAESDRVRMLADSMGFRQLYHTDPGATGEAAISTSALSIAQIRGCGLDHRGLGVQSLLGWQLGQRTLFAGVTKLAPGSIASISGEGVQLTQPDQDTDPGVPDLADAVRVAAHLLRESLGALLDDHPDAVLQLTGGQDSRILLSAIPVARRRGLRAMTLGVPGSGDVDVASQIAVRYGLNHEVHGLASLQDLTPQEAWDLARAASVRLDAMSDPIALAALAVGESMFDQGVRISGLGGEVARGFYYVGKVKSRPYSRREAERLASWRMFANEAVEPGILTPEFTTWARDVANADVYAALLDGGVEWFSATDHLYLRHRMQRWAGVTDTAVAYQRIVINPMLDEKFLDLASRLAPKDKAHSVFLARLQMELDPELGRLPLENRPAPVSYSEPSMRSAIDHTYSTGLRFARKLAQRARGENRPPAGGSLLASKVVSHWREHPSLLESTSRLEILNDSWISEMLDGKLEPRPSTVGFLTNLVIAHAAASGRVGGIYEDLADS